MKLHIRATAYSTAHKTDGTIKLEIDATKENVFEMMDEMKPNILAEYLALRMKPEQCAGVRLVEILGEEGGAK